MTTTTTNLTPFESYISEMFEVEELSKIEMIAMELQAYGVESLEQFNDSYSGCFPLLMHSVRTLSIVAMT